MNQINSSSNQKRLRQNFQALKQLTQSKQGKPGDLDPHPDKTLLTSSKKEDEQGNMWTVTYKRGDFESGLYERETQTTTFGIPSMRQTNSYQELGDGSLEVTVSADLDNDGKVDVLNRYEVPPETSEPQFLIANK